MKTADIVHLVGAGPRVYVKKGDHGSVDDVTAKALTRLSNATSLPIVITQGISPYSHDVLGDGGVVDLRVGDLYTRGQRRWLLTTAELQGWASKDLGPDSGGYAPGATVQGFDRHVHLVLANHPGLSKAGLAQVRAFNARRVFGQDTFVDDVYLAPAGSRVRLYIGRDAE